jgi:hypothetical protein
LKPSELLSKARELLADEERVTSGWFARNKFKERVDADDPEAVCWCSMGALEKVAPGRENRALRADAQLFLHRAIGAEAIGHSLLYIADWHDATWNAGAFEREENHRMILAGFDKAIKLAARAESCIRTF